MIRLRTLGGLDLGDSEGRELRAVLAQPKRLALLAYLALASPRGFHRRDALLALLWPEHDAEHARKSLNQSVHILRRHLGPDAIVANGDALGLDWTDLWATPPRSGKHSTMVVSLKRSTSIVVTCSRRFTSRALPS